MWILCNLCLVVLFSVSANSQSDGPSQDFPPNITYFSKSPEVTLIGSWIVLKCIFSGNPPPEITWSRSNHNLHSGQISLLPHEAELTISNMTESDGGDYVCAAKNYKGNASYIHNIRVEAVPIFKQKPDRPGNVTVTEGDSISFNCSAFAIPEATVVWFWNGQPINVGEASKRFVFSNDRKHLMIRDVCRDCDNRESKTNLMVIQCNASNVHGYAFAQGYLNILLRTKVTLQPNSTFVSVDLTKENLLQFYCSATSDPSTSLTVQWYKVMDQEGRELEGLYNEPPWLSVMNGNMTLWTEPKYCSDTCYKYLGEYMCVADNKFTKDNITVILINSTTDSTEAPLQSASLNWIVIGIAIVLFLLLMILICCILCQLSRGAEYDVDRKERKSGRNPEEEIQANDFQHYFPCEYVKRKGIAASLESADFNFRDMDDLSEYDDDVLNFGEDGSFVGNYSNRHL